MQVQTTDITKSSERRTPVTLKKSRRNKTDWEWGCVIKAETRNVNIKLKSDNRKDGEIKKAKKKKNQENNLLKIHEYKSAIEKKIFKRNVKMN